MKNEKYSLRDFTNRDLSKEPAKDFEGEIIGSCFFQENKPNSEIFPEGITCTFIRCNLDNVKVPKGCVVEGGTNKQILVQNDLSDWILDAEGKPSEPMDKKIREALSISCDPKDIPETKQTVTVVEKARVS